MIIPVVSFMAIRCPSCGRLQIRPLSLPACRHGQEVTIDCCCQAPLFSYTLGEERSFRILLHCLLCEGIHSVSVSLKQLADHAVVPITCEVAASEVAYIGPKDRLRSTTRVQERRLRELIRDLGKGNYFNNPEVMYRVLQHLHQLALSGRLYCHCGNNDIEVEIFPDHLELHCPECEATGSVMAESREDLTALKKIREIELVGHGFRCRRASRNPGSPGHSSKK